MTIAKIFRAMMLGTVGIGGIIAPTPAAADVAELRECLHNCYIAYYVETYQPGFYQMCAYNCNALYGTSFAAATTDSPLAVTRYG